MGIPKFFRYIAQRWPLTSQQVNDNVIPEFDNLYLDMNSILHTATHNNAENLGHISEDQMYLQICNYIEHLFAVISPRKVFFMAIDGVAPRAKMNQQRARRFRSAMDAEEARRKAASRGEVLDEDPFDSNCITPGTEFMMRLTQRLRYFIARKITEDTRWQGCNVILSGHEVPGEGEHKIMRFIRNLRSQPEYDPNTRHCLYGLDADLIMLGLSTHEPHFALLREEVTFGRQVRFQSAELSDKRFILLQLSLVREYIKIEFHDEKNPTPPDFERMLDDFVLINFFIGNDFLPELPMLMVNEGAIPVILDTYKSYLRVSGNKYLSTNGLIDFLALKEWMEHLKVYQIRKFEESSQDLSWFNARLEDINSAENSDILVLTPSQRLTFDAIAPFMLNTIKHDQADASLEVQSDEPKFVELLAKQTGFEVVDNKLRFVSGSVDSKAARKIIRLYDHAHVTDPSKKLNYAERFAEWKNKYYYRKFGDTSDSQVVVQTAKKYLEGLQWVLSYYYRGCPSWSWFYDNHYAPMTTEIITAIGDGFVPQFDEGVPFLPFEQLMSVLPDRSAKLLPPALRPLVVEPTSPIIDFYPHEFAVDKNGKRADWEAVVLIPFIDQDRLLKYVKPIEETGLTSVEMQRNSQGLEYEFLFDPNAATLYKAPAPSLADIPACTCVVKALTFPSHDIRYGLLDGAVMGVNARAGFPSLYTLPFDWAIASGQGVKVFEMPSRDDSVILSIGKAEHPVSVGDRVFVNWPFLSEAQVTQVLPRAPIPFWTRDLPRITEYYQRHGVKIGETEALVRVRHLQGLGRQADGSYLKEFGGEESVVPVQLVVPSIAHEDERFIERPAQPITEEFPLESNILLLLAKYYGFPAKVNSHKNNSVDVEVLVPRYRDPLFAVARAVVETEKTHIRWSTTDQVAKSLGLSVKFLLQLTARLVVDAGGDTINVSFPLRKHGLGLMAEGYSRLGFRGMWEFSDRGVALLLAYLRQFRDAFTRLRDGASKLDANVAKEMREWVKSHSEQIAFLPTSTNHLTHQSVASIEAKVLQMPPTHLEKVVVKGIDRGALLAPKHAQHQLRSQNFKLGDRVVSALSFGKVPLYMRGTVVGVNGGTPITTTLDVLWDHEFAAASTLDGRTKSKRGLTVPAGSVLNVSFAQLAYQQDNQPSRHFVNARVDTRSTLVTGGAKSNRGQTHQSKSFAPAEPHNDWGAPKQVKTNASGQQLLQALGRPSASVQQASSQAATANQAGYATSTTPKGPPLFNSESSSKVSHGDATENATEDKMRPQPKSHMARGSKKPDSKDSKQPQSSNSTKRAEVPQKKQRPGVSKESKDSKQPKESAQPQDGKSKQLREASKQKGPGPKAEEKSDGKQGVKSVSQPGKEPEQKKPEQKEPEHKKPEQKKPEQKEPEQKKPEQGKSELSTSPSFTLPEVKGAKPPSAESAKTLLDALMLKK